MFSSVIYGSQPEGNESPLDTQENVLSFLHSCASIAPTYLSLGNQFRLFQKVALMEPKIMLKKDLEFLNNF